MKMSCKMLDIVEEIQSILIGYLLKQNLLKNNYINFINK